jgi:hypothetical protein
LRRHTDARLAVDNFLDDLDAHGAKLDDYFIKLFECHGVALTFPTPTPLTAPVRRLCRQQFHDRIGAGVERGVDLGIGGEGSVVAFFARGVNCALDGVLRFDQVQHRICDGVELIPWLDVRCAASLSRSVDRLLGTFTHLSSPYTGHDRPP